MSGRAPKTAFRIGEWSVRPDLHVIAKGDDEVHLEPKAMKLLVCLAARAPDVVLKEELIEEVWDGAFVSDEVITYNIGALRKAFSDDARNPRFIQTVPKKGYRLVAPVEDGAPNVPRVSGRRRIVGLTVLATVVLAAALVWMTRSRESERPVSPTAVTVLPFAVHGGDDIAYLGDAMVDLLSTKLDGAGALTSVDPRAVLSALSGKVRPLGPEQGLHVAERFNAALYVLGSVTEVGDRLQLQASLYDVENGLEAQADAEVAGESEILEGLDQLALDLLSSQLAQARKRLPGVASVSTDSFAALKAFLEGERLYRSSSVSQARERFQEAVDADPSFALAWYWLAVTRSIPAATEGSLEAVERALALSGRLSLVDRTRAEAFEAYLKGRTEDAGELFRRVLGLDPADVESWAWLGQMEFERNWRIGRPVSDSRGELDRALTLDPSHRLAAWTRRHPLFFRGDPDSYLTRIRAEPRVVPLVLWERFFEAFFDGDTTQQMRIVAEARKTQDYYLVSTAAFAMRWALEGSLPEEDATLMIDLLGERERDPEVRSLSPLFRAMTSLAHGRVRKARGELLETESLHRVLGLESSAYLAASPFLAVESSVLEETLQEVEAWDAAAVPESANRFQMFRVHDGFHPLIRLYLAGILHARLGHREKALAYGTELETATGPADAGSLPGDFAKGVRAQVAWYGGEPARALEELEAAEWRGRWLTSRFMLASFFFMQPAERYLRAVALQDLGAHERALGWLDTLEHVPLELAYVAPSHFRRAVSLQALGRPNEAIAHYEKFIELWEDCDPELRFMVDDARKRLAKLQL